MTERTSKKVHAVALGGFATSNSPPQSRSAHPAAATAGTNRCTWDFCTPDRGAWIPCYNLTETQRARLAALNLDAVDFAFFVDIFMGHPWCYATKTPAYGWVTSRGRIGASLILDHLAGARWLATGARKQKGGRARTHLFVVDLDQQATGAGMEDIVHRYDRVIRALGGPSLVMRSSDSGGLHLYYILSASVDLYRIRNRLGTRGAAIRLLVSEGLYETNGRVEVYPRSHTKEGGIQNRVRLPFGSGSRLLDADTLLPMRAGNSPLQDLQLVRTLFEDSKMNVFNFDELYDRACRATTSARRPRSSVDGRGRRRSSAVQASYPADALAISAHGVPSEVAALLHAGLLARGTFNSACHRLARHFVFHLDEASAGQQLHEWLDSHHNGCSSTYNRSAVTAHAELDRVIAHVYQHCRRSRAEGRPALSDYEANTVFAVGSHSGGLYDLVTGAPIKRFKLERFAFDLLRGAKQALLAEGESTFSAVTLRWPQLSPHSREFAWRFQSEANGFWPDLESNLFVVPIPYTLRIMAATIGEATQAAHFRALLTTGLLEQRREADWGNNQCATFAVRLDFGAYSHGESFRTLESAVTALLSPAEARTRYTRHFLSCVRQHAAPTAVVGSISPPAFVSAFVGLVRARLMQRDSCRPQRVGNAA